MKVENTNAKSMNSARTIAILLAIAFLFIISPFIQGVFAFYPSQQPIQKFKQNSGGLSHPTYALFSSGNMWVATGGGIMKFTPESSGAITSNENNALTLSDKCATALAFDSAGNLWATDASGGSCSSDIIEFEAPLSSSSTTVTDTNAAISSPEGLAFDQSGNLWVANTGSANILEFTGTVTSTSAPAVTLTLGTGSFSKINGITFDPSGNLWISDSGNKALYEFSKSSISGLSGANAVSPSITITLSTSTDLYGMEFDASGNLWVADCGSGGSCNAGTGGGNGAVYELTAPLSSSSGIALTLTGGSNALKNPQSIAFDDFGTLWATDTGNGDLAEFSSILLGPSQGKAGSTIQIFGTGLAANTVYDYCFNTGVTSPSSACPTTNTLTSTSSGNIPTGTSLLIPSGSTTGSLEISVASGTCGASSGVTICAATTFVVSPTTFTTSPSSGYVGSSVTIAGVNFAHSSTITIDYRGAAVTTYPSPCTSDSTGAFSCSFIVPESVPGGNPFAVSDGTTTISSFYTVSSSISLAPSTDAAGTKIITVTGHAFAPSSTVTISYDGTIETTTPATCFTGATGSSTIGKFTCKITVAASTTGSPHTISATDGINTATAPFTVTGTTASSTAVSCTHNPIDQGYATTCTATVSPSPTGGTESIQWVSSGSGTFSATTCSLASGTCSVTYTPSVEDSGTITITGTYQGDGTYAGSSNTVSLVVDTPPAAGSLSSTASASLDVGESTTISTSGASGGSGSGTYTYAWTNLPSGCSSSNSASISCTPTATTNSPFTTTLTVTDSNGGTATSTMTLNVYADPTVSVTPTGPVSYGVGQSATALTASVTYTGTNTASVEWYSSATSACSASATDTRSSGTSYTPGTASPGTTYYCAVVSDSGVSSYHSASNVVQVSVSSSLSVPTPTATHNPADVGQSITFTASPTGGSGSYSTYSWSGLPTGCTATNSATITCTPSTTTGSPFSVTVKVTDSNSNTATSNALSFTVDPALALGGLTSSTGSAVDVSQQTTIQSSGATGGSGTYTYAWTNLPNGCSSSNSVSISCTPSTGADSGSPYTVTLTATDGNGNAASKTYTLAVDQALSIGVVSSSAGSPIDVGQGTTLQSSGASGGSGSGTYTYAWTNLPSGCSSSNSASISCTPTATTNSPFTTTLTVTDSNGNTAVTAVSLTIDSALSVPAPGVNHASADVGQSVTFTASPTGGSGTYSTYSWSGLPTGCTPANAATITCSPTSVSGSPFSVTVAVMDSNGNAVTSSAATFTLYDDPTVGVTPSGPLSYTSGQTAATLSASVTYSGPNTASVEWYSSTTSSCSSSSTDTRTSGTSFTPSTTSVGTTYYCAVASDSSVAAYHSASNAIEVTVNGAGLSASPSATINPVDAGQATVISAGATDSSGSITKYTWSGLPSGCSSPGPGNVASFTCTPAAGADTGSPYTVQVVIDDSAANTITKTFTLTVDPALSLGSLSSSSGSTIDVSQATMLTSSGATGGSGTYTYAWTNLPSGCASSDTHSLSCTPSSTTNSPFTVTLTVTDSNANTATAAVTLTIDSALVVPTPTATHNPADVGQSVTFTASPTGGSGTYSTYSWSGLPTGCTPANAATITCSPTSVSGSPFSVTVSVTDSNGQAVTSSSLSVTVDSALSAGAASASPDPIDVNQETTISTSGASGGLGPYHYAWTNLPASCTSSDAASITCTPGTAGTYTGVTLTVTDANGNAVTSSFTLTVRSSLSISTQLASSVVIDSGQTYEYTVAASGGTGSYSYSWSLPSGVTASSGCSSGSTCTVTSTTPSSYTIGVQVTDTGLGSASSSSSLAVHSFPTISTPLVTPATIDAGQTYQYSVAASGGTGTYSYSWNLPSGVTSTSGCGSTDSTCTVSSSAASTYTVSVTVSDGGSSGTGGTWPSSSSALTVDSALGLTSLSSPITIDAGQTYTYSATASGGSGSYGYAWTIPGADSISSGCGATSASCTVLAGAGGSGTISLAVSDTGSMGTGTMSSSSSLTVDSALTISTGLATPVTIDSGQSYQYSVSAAGGTGSYSYSWNLPSGVTSTSGCGSTDSTCTVSSSAASTYTIGVEVTDSSSQGTGTASSSSSLGVSSGLSAPTISVDHSTLDSGQSGTLSVTSGFGSGSSPYTCQWLVEAPGGSYTTLGASFTCTATTTSYTQSTGALGTTGVWHFELQVTDGASTPSVSVSAAVTVTVNPSLGTSPISPASPTIDSGQSVTLTASPTGGTGPDSYQWYTSSDCSTLPVSNAVSPTFSPSPTTATTYYVLVTDSTGATSCSAGDMITVDSALSAGGITPASPIVSSGASVTLTANPSGGTPAYSYQWFTGAGCTSPISGATSATYVASPTTATTYYYKVTDSASSPSSACSAGDGVSLFAPSTPPPALSPGSLSPSSANIVPGQSVTFRVSPTGGVNPYTYIWNLPSGATVLSGCGPTDSTCTVSASSPGTYSISVKVTDFLGTSAVSPSATLTVALKLSTGGISPPSPAIDSGQSLILAVSPTGGTGPYTYQWFTGSGCTALITGATGDSLNISPSATTTYSVRVTDSSGTSSCSTSDTVTVNTPLVAGPISPTTPKVTAGKSIAITANPSGGTSPYSYQWYTGSACSSAVSGGTGATLTVSPASNTTYSYRVSDSARTPASECSPSVLVTVISSHPVLKVSPTSGPAGTLIFLGGTNFTPVATYNYCFEPGATTSSMTACPSTFQFTATSLGGVPSLTVLTAFGESGLVVVSNAHTGQIVAFAEFLITTSSNGPTISVNPSSGVTGTPITLAGSGFTPGTPVSIVVSRGVVATATAGSDGSFTTTFDVPSSPPGSEIVTAVGGDVSTDPGDVATTNLQITNVGDYHSIVVPTIGTNGTFTLNETSTTGVSVTVSGIPGIGISSLRIELANLTAPSYNVTSPGFTGAFKYYDVYVVGNGTLTSGMVANVCITDSLVTSGTAMQYWNGVRWVNPSGVTQSGDKICGSVPVTGLGGTNFVIGNDLSVPVTTTTSSTSTATAPTPIVKSLSWVWLVIVPLLVASLVIGWFWWFLIFGRRRKDEDEVQPTTA